MNRIGAIGAFAIGVVAIGAAVAFVAPAPTATGTIGRDAIGTVAIGAPKPLYAAPAPTPAPTPAPSPAPTPPPSPNAGLDGVIGAHAIGAYNKWLRKRREEEAMVLGRSYLA
jgi:hypothetical protein